MIFVIICRPIYYMEYLCTCTSNLQYITELNNQSVIYNERTHTP